MTGAHQQWFPVFDNIAREAVTLLKNAQVGQIIRTKGQRLQPASDIQLATLHEPFLLASFAARGMYIRNGWW